MVLMGFKMGIMEIPLEGMMMVLRMGITMEMPLDIGIVMETILEMGIMMVLRMEIQMENPLEMGMIMALIMGIMMEHLLDVGFNSNNTGYYSGYSYFIMGNVVDSRITNLK